MIEKIKAQVTEEAVQSDEQKSNKWINRLQEARNEQKIKKIRKSN